MTRRRPNVLQGPPELMFPALIDQGYVKVRAGALSTTEQGADRIIAIAQAHGHRIRVIRGDSWIISARGRRARVEAEDVA